MNKHDKRHQQQVNNYAAQIDRIYRQAMTEFGLLAGNGGVILSADKVFDFDNYPKLKKQADKIIADMTNEIETVITNGIKLEWALSNDKNDILCNKALGGIKNSLSDQQLKKYYNNNETARDAFKQRQVGGLNLSDRVWNYTNQFKSEIEMGLDLGLRDGLSAAEMSRDVRQYLKYPDKLFRRVRDEHGNLQLSKAAAAFHPGQGVYRSSYKNAMRLTRTETNMAYRTSDYTRWQQLDFVVGIEIRTSNNHPIVDICDELKGKYPKDFKFVGWHPQCRCHAVPILKTPEEMEADNERIMNGEELNGESVNRVDDVPQQFKQWTTDNEKRLTTAKSIPYFLSDNPQYTGVKMEYTAKQAELKHLTMSKRLEILKKSLIKKEQQFNEKLQNHIDTVKQTNGQPLNDKRNGQATLNKWDRQNESLRNLQDSIQKTKNAIEREERKIMDVEKTNKVIPIEILELVEKGELVQWRKHPNTFFVPDVDKARIVWDNKRKVVAHRYAHLITEQEQRTKFVRLYNGLNSVLNGR